MPGSGAGRREDVEGEDFRAAGGGMRRGRGRGPRSGMGDRPGRSRAIFPDGGPAPAPMRPPAGGTRFAAAGPDA